MRRNLHLIITSVAVIAGVVLLVFDDYRWLGHSIIGLAAFGYAVMTAGSGLALARRIRRPPSRDRLRNHKTFGVAAATLMVVSLGTGLAAVFLKFGANLFHAANALPLAVLAAVQIRVGLARRRQIMKTIHRWAGYAFAGIAVSQVALGVFLSPLLPGELPRYVMPWLAPVEEAWQPDGVIGPQEYFFTRVVDDGNYRISYRTDDTHVYVGLEVKTGGWIGIGMQQRAGNAMRGADMVFAYVSDGQVTVQDYFGTSRADLRPDVDIGGTEDIAMYGGHEADGITTIEFSRSRLSRDRHDMSLRPGVQTILWAYGSGDVPGMHMAQGQFDLVLKQT